MKNIRSDDLLFLRPYYYYTYIGKVVWHIPPRRWSEKEVLVLE